MFRLPVKAPMGGCDAPSLLGALTARETFKVGIDLGEPVSLDYFDRQPYAFEGKVSASVQLK
jgi:hypothetical protein